VKIRVVLADDHVVVRAGLRAMLEGDEEIDIVGEAANGTEAIALARRVEPDVILMDLRMPDVDGVTATATIREQEPDVHVLVLTTYETDADIVRAVGAGATGYLLKDATRDEVLRAIRSAAAGEAALASRVASRLMNRMRAPGEEALTAREIEVISLVARGQTNKEIANALYLSEATIKTHLLHVFAKLGVDDRTEAVTVAAKRGILPIED
jgi:DNA-binding NarL/FixJ family response regulator